MGGEVTILNWNVNRWGVVWDRAGSSRGHPARSVFEGYTVPCTMLVEQVKPGD